MQNMRRREMWTHVFMCKSSASLHASNLISFNLSHVDKIFLTGYLIPLWERPNIYIKKLQYNEYLKPGMPKRITKHHNNDNL